MYGKTVGIIGTGKIAKKLIMILRGFGMNVLAYDLYPDYNFAREHQVVYTTLDELYHSSDIIPCTALSPSRPNISLTTTPSAR